MSDVITLGIVELNSISKGIFTCDIMMKTSAVELIESYPVCSGKYIIIISGDVASVESSIHEGIKASETYFVDYLIIPHIHQQIIPGLLGTSKTTEINAVGVLETFSVASTIIAADASLKSSNVDIIEIRLAKGLGGKAFYTLTGSIASVKSAIEAGTMAVQKDGVLLNKEIITNPHESLKQQLLEW